MYPRKRRPSKHENPGRNQERAHNGRRKTKLRLAGALDARLSLKPVDEPAPDAVPQRIRHDAKDHAHQDARKGQAHLPGIEAVVRPKHERKGPEEEVQDAEEDGREETQVQAHGFEEEELKGPQEGLADGVGDGPLELVCRGCPSGVAGLDA